MAICLVTIDDGNKCLNQVPTYGDRCSEHQGVELKYFYGFYTYPNYRVIDNDIERKNIDPVTLKDTAHSFHHCNLDFIICKDGLILVSSNEINSRALKFRDSVKMSAGIGDWPTNQLNWNEYLNIINVIHILLYCVQKTVPQNAGNYFKFYDITQHDVIKITYQNGIPTRQVNYGHELSLSLIRSSILTPEKSQSYLTPNYIPTSIFIELEKYIRKLDFGSNKVQHLRDLGKIIGRFNDEDYRGAFLLGWLFIEESLTKRWIKYLDSKNTQINEEVNRISKNRKKILTGRDYSISIIIDQLELNERITLNEYNEYSKLRKIRNKIVHNDYRPTLSDAENMNRVIRPIFEELVQFKLEYPEHVYGSTGL